MLLGLCGSYHSPVLQTESVKLQAWGISTPPRGEARTAPAGWALVCLNPTRWEDGRALRYAESSGASVFSEGW